MFLFGMEIPIDDIITTPGEHSASVDAPTLFVLRPVVRDGFVATPESITLEVDTCTTTTDPGTTITQPPSSPSTLPFTGFESPGLLIGAVSLMTLGSLLVLGFRRRDEEDPDPSTIDYS
jgi:hypothetical protein